MRQKIKFPNRTKPVEREVHQRGSVNYINSKGYEVPVVLFAGQWIVAPGWEWVYEGRRNKCLTLSKK